MSKLIIFIISVFLFSPTLYASTSIFQWGLIDLPILPILSGDGEFVEAFNFCFTLVTWFGLIAVVLKAMIKVLTRS